MASAVQASSSRSSAIFWPKPPPTSSETTVTWDSESLSREASADRRGCRACAPAWMVRWRRPRSQVAMQPRGSSGMCVCRCWEKRASTTRCAAAKAASTSPAANSWRATRLEASAGSTRMAPGARAASIEAQADSGRYSTSMASAASSAASRVSATMATTGSPAKRTRSTGKGGTSTGCRPSIGGAMRSVVARAAKSGPVQVATTPGMARAASVDSATMSAWACGLRRKTRCSARGTSMSSTKRPSPRRSRSSSSRVGDVPSMRCPLTRARPRGAPRSRRRRGAAARAGCAGRGRRPAPRAAPCRGGRRVPRRPPRG